MFQTSGPPSPSGHEIFMFIYFPNFMAEFRVLTSISATFFYPLKPGCRMSWIDSDDSFRPCKKKHTLWSSNVAGWKIPYYR